MRRKVFWLVSVALLPGICGSQVAAQTQKQEPTVSTAKPDDAPSGLVAAPPATGEAGRNAPADTGKAANGSESAAAREEVESATPPAKPKAHGDVAGDIIVTGSQIRGSDPTSDVKVYTAEDIKALGVSNVQDFIRSLPLNQASVGYGINNRRTTEVRFDGGGLGGLGVAGVNLRGLGTKNTLVLVNGRRIAGAAGVEEGFANINSIPLAAVDRVEISLSGNSAVYGADALGGVVNFILKKHYRGLSATARQEFSSTGADTRQSTLTAATGWQGGSVTATLSYTKLDPVSNTKLGYVTHDYRNRISEAQAIAVGRANYPRDQRLPEAGGQPAAINLTYSLPTPYGDQYARYYYQYRRGNAIAHPTRADLQPIDFDTLASGIPPDAGEYQESLGASVSFDQNISDRLHLTVDYFGSRNHMYLRESHDIIKLEFIPLTQAYSPFKASDLLANAKNASFHIYYDPRKEYQDGRLKPGFMDSTIWSHSVTTGLQYKFGEDAELRANVSYSQNQVFAIQEGLRTVDQIDRKTGGCGRGDTPIEGVRNFEQVVARQCAALTSSDPALAFNVLNDGTSRAGAPPDIFFVHIQNLSNRAFHVGKDILLTLAPVTLPAGKVKIALGTESFSYGTTGVRIKEETEEDVKESTSAGYAEMRVPLVNAAMHVPLIEALDLSLKARYNRYATRGPIGTVDNIPYEDGGKLIRGKASFSRVSPDIGTAWSPTSGLLVRGSWSSSFSPPEFTELYSIHAGQTYEEYVYWDPYSPDGEEFQFREIVGLHKANPLLRPSTSSSYHAGVLVEPKRVFNGLSLLVDYYNTVINDRIGSTNDLQILLPRRDYLAIKDIWIRDAEGFVIRKEVRPLNVGSVRSESLDVAASYAFQIHAVTVTPFVNYTRNLRQQFAYQGHVLNNSLGTTSGLDRYRYEAGVSIITPTLSARVARRFIPAYDNTYAMSYDEGAPEDADRDGVIDSPFPIHSLATYDLNVRWQPIQPFTIAVGGRNIFNAKPPFAVIDSRPFDGARYDIRGRVLYAEVKLQF